MDKHNVLEGGQDNMGDATINKAEAVMEALESGHLSVAKFSI